MLFPRVALLACPFCRELFKKGETVACPVCGVALVALETLPLSDDAAAEHGLERRPEHELLPWAYPGRGRALLGALAIAGFAAFFLPWFRFTMPDIGTFSGLDIARARGWVWGVAVAWFVLFPTALSRRTIAQMRGARVAAAFLAAVPGLTAAMLLAMPPAGSHGVVLHFTFQTGIYATLGISLAALGGAVAFGGSIDDISLRRGTSVGQVVH
jgi:hypothetical protein